MGRWKEDTTRTLWGVGGGGGGGVWLANPLSKKIRDKNIFLYLVGEGRGISYRRI